MNNESNNDLRINGSMSLAGGTFNKVSVNGDATITSDIICEELKVNGMAKFKGDVKAFEAKVNGKAIFDAALYSDLVKINGEARIAKNADIKNLKIAGAGYFGESISSETIDILGAIDVKGDCVSEKFVSRGGFNICGLLNSGSIDITISHTCTVREIGGEKIVVKNGKGMNFRKLLHFAFLSIPLLPRLEAELIECDNIYLENVKAKIVRGNRVTIGLDCEIETVEYKSSFEKLSNAEVRNHKKII